MDPVANAGEDLDRAPVLLSRATPAAIGGFRGLLLAVILGIAACAPTGGAPTSSPADAASLPPSTSTPTASGSPVPVSPARPSAIPTPSETPAPDPIGDVQCEGGATTSTIDYAAGASGGPPDLEAATRALAGVRPTDQIVVDADRSAVRRDGRTVFTGWWFVSASGGWLLSTAVACGDSGIRSG